MNKVNKYTNLLKKQYDDIFNNMYNAPILSVYNSEEINELYNKSEIRNKNIGSVVLCEDTIPILLNIVDKKLKPLLVVQSNGASPIPSIENGSVNSDLIYYCSNVITCLNDTQKIASVRDGDILVAQDVVIFKDNKFNKIRTCNVDVLFASPPRKPHIISYDGDYLYQNSNEKNEMYNILNLIFMYANVYNYDYIVMDDFGCVIEENPKLEVVNMLNELTKKFNIPGMV